MFGIGGFNPLNMVSQVALAAATGGTSLLVQAAVQAVVSAVVQQVIQQVGQQLGLPPEVIQMAEQAFSAASGNVGGAASGVGGFASQGFGNVAAQGVNGAIQQLAQLTHMTPHQEGQVSHAANNTVDTMSTMLGNMAKEAGIAAKKNEHAKASDVTGGASSKGKSFLMAIADALGAQIDAKMTQMVNLSNQIKTQTTDNTKFVEGLGSKPSQGDQIKANDNSQKLGTLNSEFNAASQELSILQNVISTVLKTVGEAESTIARKG